MTKRDQSVKTYGGTPPAGAFGATQGTPIVIDYAAAIGYFLHPITSVVTALGGGGGGGVTSVSGTGSQYISVSVTNPTTTPAIAVDLIYFEPYTHTLCGGI